MGSCNVGRMPTSAERYRAARTARMRELTGAPGFRRNRLLAAIPGIVIGLIVMAGLRSIGVGAVVALVAGAAGPLIYWWSAYHRASTEARESVMTAWASEHGWTHSEQIDPPGDIAFCRNRQKPRASDGFAGPMCGLDGLIFNFTYSTYETRTRTVTDANGNVRTETYQQEVKHHHTVLRLGLGEIPGIPTMQLSQKRFAMFDKLVAAFGPSRVEETESSEFNDRYRLLVSDSADEIAVKRVFTPAPDRAGRAGDVPADHVSVRGLWHLLHLGGHLQRRGARGGRAAGGCCHSADDRASQGDPAASGAGPGCV